jgi:2-oxoglutarate ferredoxin oxidoreductase subunit alpha
MGKHLTWMVGGQQGDGFSSSGETFALGLNRLGYFIYGYFTNSSRILGGHANYRVRIGTESKLANADELDMLIAFDQETIEINASKLRHGGIVLCDESMEDIQLPEDKNLQLVKVPMYAIAEELGTKLVKNMVSVGASAALVGVSPEIFSELMAQRFARKGEKVVNMNVQAIQQGYDYVKENYAIDESFHLPPVKKVKRMLMTGNDAIGLGSAAGGCRTMYAYPITPATDIMEYLAKKLPKLGGIVLQTEDEIAAINMVIGSAYAGARSMTATSGPGLSLMMEAIGLSGMTETPVVIINTQRGGPSTGLPTKHEQSDLNAALYGTHGEIQKIVLAPSTAEECYYEAVRAFNLAEKYQCPVILMTDLALSQATQTVNYIDPVQPAIDRGKLVELPEKDQTDAQALTNDEDRYKLFKRYEKTEDGISPRILPGTPKGIHHVTGVEHSEVGRPSELAPNRHEMMDKRQRKMKDISIPDSVDFVGPEDSDILIIGWGSSRGVIDEARERLLEEGVTTTHAHVKVLMPFPTEELTPYIKNAKKVLFVENNSTGQLAALTRQHVGTIEGMEKILKYNGEPFYPHEIEGKLKEMIEWQRLKTSVMM